MNTKIGNGTDFKLSVPAKHDARIAKGSAAPDFVSFAKVWLEISTMLVERMVDDCSQPGVR